MNGYYNLLFVIIFFIIGVLICFFSVLLSYCLILVVFIVNICIVVVFNVLYGNFIVLSVFRVIL